MFSEEIFFDKLSSLLPRPQQQKILLAASGGVDSMCLLYLLHQYCPYLEVAHVNYHLRGQDSNDDETVVRNFCIQHQIPFHIYSVTSKDGQPVGGSIQLWARDLRYRFFYQVMHQFGLDYLFTAHHLNDQLETFLINLSRGSGLRGLAGIPKRGHQIIRPLLETPKVALYEFAKKHQIPYREDLSNTKSDYLRNFIRNIIAPELLHTNPNFLDNFKKSIGIVAEAQDFIQENISQKIKNLTLKDSPKEIELDREALSKESDFVKYEILSRFGFTDRKAYHKIFNAETGRQFISDSHRLIIHRQVLIITAISVSSPLDSEEIILDYTVGQPIRLRDYICLDNYKEQIWYFDTMALEFPLKLRHKREGDVFYPKGMRGKKKVSKFFKDEKLSILAKPKVWLLCDAQDRVLGIIPLRQDGRWANTQGNLQQISIIL